MIFHLLYLLYCGWHIMHVSEFIYSFVLFHDNNIQRFIVSPKVKGLCKNCKEIINIKFIGLVHSFSQA